MVCLFDACCCLVCLIVILGLFCVLLVVDFCAVLILVLCFLLVSVVLWYLDFVGLCLVVWD